MRYLAWIVTPWVVGAPGVPPHLGGGNHPKLVDEYPHFGWQDVTGQPARNIPTAINEYTIEVVVDDSVLAAIQADSEYEVLWADPMEVPGG